MEIHSLHGVARVKEMEMAHCISHALGHPRTVGVSAWGGFLRELFRRVDQQNRLSECVHYLNQRVVHIMSIVGVCPIDIHWRVVHKIDYRSVSFIYIGGLSTGKHKYLCLEMVFIHGKMHV